MAEIVIKQNFRANIHLKKELMMTKHAVIGLNINVQAVLLN